MLLAPAKVREIRFVLVGHFELGQVIDAAPTIEAILMQAIKKPVSEPHSKHCHRDME